MERGLHGVAGVGGAHLSLESQLASGASQFSASILRAAIWAEVWRPACVPCDRAAFLFTADLGLALLTSVEATLCPPLGPDSRGALPLPILQALSQAVGWQEALCVNWAQTWP